MLLHAVYICSIGLKKESREQISIDLGGCYFPKTLQYQSSSSTFFSKFEGILVGNLICFERQVHEKHTMFTMKNIHVAKGCVAFGTRCQARQNEIQVMT